MRTGCWTKEEAAQMSTVVALEHEKTHDLSRKIPFLLGQQLHQTPHLPASEFDLIHSRQNSSLAPIASNLAGNIFFQTRLTEGVAKINRHKRN